MVAISFAATNFPMENLIQVDEMGVVDGFGEGTGELKRSIVSVDLNPEQGKTKKKDSNKDPNTSRSSLNQSMLSSKSSQKLNDTKLNQQN